MKQLENYLKKNKKTHIIFDLDETIAELLLPWDEWYEQMGKIVSEYDADIWRKFKRGEISESGFQNEVIKNFGNEARVKMNECSSTFETSRYEGVRKNKELVRFIEANFNKYIFFVWSNNSRKVIEKVLNEENLRNCFKLIVSRDDVYYLKPYPDGFKLIDDGKTPIENYLFIGDSENDEGAAKSLKMDFFKVAF